jgi:hypothetical protein
MEFDPASSGKGANGKYIKSKIVSMPSQKGKMAWLSEKRKMGKTIPEMKDGTVLIKAEK